MLGMLKRHEVEILLEAGHRKTEVARLSGVSLRSVKRIAEESPVVHVDDAAERGKRQMGRPSTVAKFRKQVIAILQETPEATRLRLGEDVTAINDGSQQGGRAQELLCAVDLHSL